MSRRLACALALAAAVAAPAGPASAYTVLKHWDGSTQKWSGTNVSWTISTNTLSDVTPESLQAALAGAFATWQAVGCSAITFTWGGYKTWDPANGIHFTFVENNWDPSVGDAAAYSVSDTNFSGAIVSNDIVFNAVDSSWSTSNVDLVGFSDIQGVATHEIGHSIGLDHSRNPDATMFFSGGSTKLRSLDDDDSRGACFLYPAGSFTQGVSCDACDTSAQCAGGNCWNWGGQFDEYSFCLEDCASDGDCPDGFTCEVVASGEPTQCFPTNGYCHQAGGNIALGDPCYGHETCESGLCLATGEAAFCSKQCSSDSQCGSGFVCFSGFCFEQGTKPYGADCTADAECQSAFCVDNLKSGTGVCSLPCGNNGGSCPDGNQCIQDVVCVPPGGSPNGTQCLYPTQCLSTYCQGALCTQPCGAGAPCPAGTACVGGWCEGAAAGGECTSGKDCPTALICRFQTEGATVGTCAWDCNALSGTGCPDGHVCKWVWESWSETIIGECAPANGGAGEGEPCADTPCEADLVCHPGWYGEPTCHKDCKLNANNLGCSATETCRDELADPDDPLRGLCIPKWLPEPTGDVGPPDAGTPDPTPDAGTPDAGTPDPTPDAGTPDAGPEDVAQPPEDAEITGDAASEPDVWIPPASGPIPRTGGSGCSGGGGAGGPVTWLLALALIVALGSRRRRPEGCIGVARRRP